MDSENKENKRKRFTIVNGQKLVVEKFHGKFFVIPAAITVVGLFSGFLAITTAFAGNFEYAAKCICVAFFLDGLDGRVARSLNATSAFGREFDSLSDLVAFGVAPAVLIYCWGFSHIADEIGVLVAFVFVVCGAIRLARFNVTTTEEPKSYFTGLPIPGAAATMTALVYFYPQAIENNLLVGALIVYMLLVAGLMVSTLSFFSLKKIKLTRDKQIFALIGLAIFVALAWKYNKAAILVGTGAYALSGLGKYLYLKIKTKKKVEEVVNAVKI